MTKNELGEANDSDDDGELMCAGEVPSAMIDQPRWKSVGVAQLLLKFVEKLVLKSGVKLGVKNQSARLSDILYASSV